MSSTVLLLAGAEVTSVVPDGGLIGSTFTGDDFSERFPFDPVPFEDLENKFWNLPMSPLWWDDAFAEEPVFFFDAVDLFEIASDWSLFKMFISSFDCWPDADS